MKPVDKILITGASGFIGGFLVEEALKRGYEVWAGVRSHSSRRHLQDERIRFIELDYAHEKELDDQLKAFAQENGGWRYVIHNAGLTKTTDKALFYEVNAENTHRFMEGLARHCPPEKFLLMSSLSSYGIGDEMGFTPIKLTDPQTPNTDYGKSKLLAENYLRQQHAFPYVILRPTGVYGPGEKDYFLEIKSIQQGLDLAVGKIPQRITFIYVKDLARVALSALEKEDIRNREYFVADGDVHTDASFARLVQELLHKKHVLHARVPLPLVYTACVFSERIGRLFHKSMTLNSDKYQILKQRNWICDITPLQQDLGFQAEYPLRKGLEECISWYKQEGWL